MKLIQLLFNIFIFYLLYKVVKNLLFKPKETKPVNIDENDQKSLVSDELIKDPYCGVFFPKNDGFSLKFKGKTYYFCSEACMRKFLETNK